MATLADPMSQIKNRKQEVSQRTKISKPARIKESVRISHFADFCALGIFRGV